MESALATAQGLKPSILIEIDWTDGGTAKYADKTVGAYRGKILSIDSLDSIIKVSEGSDSTQVTLTLDDTDGSIKGIIDNVDVHKRPARLYQWFEGLGTDDKFLLFAGQVSSPILWDEGTRAVTIDIVTRIEDAEVGFSIEEGQFPLLATDLVGKPWPLVFGRCVNVPALKITTPREGTLIDGFGIRDYTLSDRNALAEIICCPNNSIVDYKIGGFTLTEQQQSQIMSCVATTPTLGQCIYVEMANRGVTDQAVNDYYKQVYDIQTRIDNGTYQLNPNQGGPEEANALIDGNVVVIPIYGPDPQCVQTRCEEVEEIVFQIQEQSSFEFSSVRIVNGEKFPQNQTITLQVGGAYITGKFAGNLFTIQKRIHPEIVELGAYGQYPTAEEIAEIKAGGVGRTLALANFGTRVGIDKAIYLKSLPENSGVVVLSTCVQNGSGYQDVTDCQANSLASLNNYPQSEFAWINAGEKVTYSFDEETVYVANILPSDIRCVTAFRNLDIGQRLLLVVPDDYYTTRVTDYGQYQVTEIVFNRPLSQIGDGWEDEIYVTLESTVGPNVVDEMQWLIENYTDFAVDAASFAATAAKVANYPADFPLLDRKNVLTALEEMAFQSRIAITLRNNTFYVKYLSESPTPVATITGADVIENTLQLTHTDTEDIVTKLIAEWKDDHARDSKQIILRNNVNKYGTQVGTFDYYIYNQFELVEKSALFWLIRKSNTWKRVTFNAPLTRLALEPLDDITVNIPQLTPGAVPGIVESATYNPDDNTVSLSIWLAVRSGEVVEYDWAFPSSTLQTWPPPNESGITFGPGSTPGSFVIAPIGHPLSDTPGTVNVPDGFPAQQFETSIDTCGTEIPTEKLQYCCGSSNFWTEQPDACGRYVPRRLDDANDIEPPGLTTLNCPGAVNLGKEPKFADGTLPKLKKLERIAKQALQTAAKAKDTAIDGGGGGGGIGSRSVNKQSTKNAPINPYTKLPKKVPLDNTGTPKPDCKTVIAISWFPIRSTGSFVGDISIPAGATQTETYEFAGCGSTSDPDSEYNKFVSAMTDAGLLIPPGGSGSKPIFTPGFANDVPGSEGTASYHGLSVFSQPNCAECSSVQNQGSFLGATAKDASGNDVEKASIVQDGDGGYRPNGYLGYTGSDLDDSALYPD